MNNEQLIMNANEVVAFLQKSPKEFTKADIMYFIRENDIEMVNLMYPGGDGKLKTLNFVITDLAYLDTILTFGERVDFDGVIMSKLDGDARGGDRYAEEGRIPGVLRRFLQNRRTFHAGGGDSRVSLHLGGLALREGGRDRESFAERLGNTYDSGYRSGGVPE